MEQFAPVATFILLYGVSYGLVLFVISIGLVLTLGLMRIANLAQWRAHLLERLAGTADSAS